MPFRHTLDRHRAATVTSECFTKADRGFRKKSGSENNGTDQVRGYCADDLHLCVRIMLKEGFLMMRLS